VAAGLYGREFLPDGGSNAESRPRGDGLIGIIFLPVRLADLFSRLEFDRLAVNGKRSPWPVGDTRGVHPVFAASKPDEFVRNGRLLFPSGI
jgi:hypothetical protein